MYVNTPNKTDTYLADYLAVLYNILVIRVFILLLIEYNMYNVHCIVYIMRYVIYII